MVRINSKALIVFAKLPLAGSVKTRLTPLLTPEDAAELYRCMLMDTLSKVKRLADVDISLFFEGGREAASYFEKTSGGMAVFPQRGGDLGERMMDAFLRTFEDGHVAVAIIGTDSPDLPVSFIEEAFLLLEDPSVDAALGPSEDGGYYLLAMKRLHEVFFRGIPWSTGEVLERSLAKAAAGGLTVALLPQWHDVDSEMDLLRPELRAAGNGAPLTRAIIGCLGFN